MKIPFQAFVLIPPRSALLPCVTVCPCVVTALFPSAGMALIEVHSLMVSGRCSRMVPFANLASTVEKAIEEASARIGKLPQLEIRTFSGTDEKTAAVAPLAGAVSG